MRLSSSLLRQQSCLMVAVLLMVFDLSAQESAYRKVMAEVENMTPYAALYRLQRFQTQQPAYAPVYIELCERELQLAADLHPIRDYAELDRRLYNAALYLGNGIHYAPQSAGTWMPRLQELRAWRTQVNEVYQSYYAMEERYTNCRHIFTELMRRYPGEKNAHLLLTDEDLSLFHHLHAEADSLAQNVARYSETVRTYGRSLPAIELQKLPIRLYRLDGLTPSDMMADTLRLWDYAGWTLRFLNEQQQVYASYLETIDRSLRTEQVSDTLINYINRLDRGSFVGHYLRVVAADRAVREDADTVDVGSEQWLQRHYRCYQYRCAARQALEECRSRVNDVEWRKYYRQLEANGDSTPEALLAHAQQRLDVVERVYANRCRRLYTTMAPNLRLHAVYTNDLSGETVSVSDFTLSDEVQAGLGTVVELIPVDRDFLIVAEAGVVCTRAKDQILTYPLIPIYTAVKLTSNRIALVGAGETLFVDREGKILTK